MTRFSRGGRTVGLAALMVFVLAACSQGIERPPPPCPDIVVVKDAADITLFKDGPGRDLTDVVLEAQIVRFGGFCETDIDEDTNTGEVTVDLQVLFRATRGPASTSREASLRYFIAISDRNDAILARAEFDSDIAFEGNRNRVAYLEELTQKIPLKAGELGDAYRVYVGFQLSDEALQYNLDKRGR
jgi:hypothetical protein